MRDGWRETTLGEVTQINPEPTADVCPDRMIKYIALAGVTKGSGINLHALSRVAFRDAPGRARRVVRRADVLVATVRPYLQGFGIVPNELDGEVASTGFAVLRARDGSVLPGYVWAHVLTPAFVDHLMARATGSNYPAVRPDDLASFPILLPPLDDQRRIVDLIAAVDGTIEGAEAFVQGAATSWRAVASAFFDGDGPTAPLSEVVTVTMGRQRSPKNAAGEHMVDYLRAANVKDGRLALDDVLRMNFHPGEQGTFRLEPGDVLVTEGCGSLKQIGASARWSAELPETVCFQNTLLRLRAIPGVTDPGFVHHLARYAFAAGWWSRISSGTNIFHIGSERAKQLEVPIIPVKDQVRLVGVLDAFADVQDGARGVLERLRSLRSAILEDLLSGDHDIPESYDELLTA